MPLNCNSSDLICPKNFSYLQWYAKRDGSWAGFHIPGSVFVGTGDEALLFSVFMSERPQQTCGICVYVLLAFNMEITETIKSEPCHGVFIYLFWYTSCVSELNHTCKLLLAAREWNWKGTEIAEGREMFWGITDIYGLSNFPQVAGRIYSFQLTFVLQMTSHFKEVLSQV